jgi:glycosyltransferase involved in cell wall biosynthesis
VSGPRLDPPVPLTIVIPVRDEVAQIAECVRHLVWADEVIVADAGSGDGTVAAARDAGARVLEGTGPTIAAQRNAAIALARNQWVFALDADERVSDALREELARVVRAPTHPVYRVRRQNFYLGRELTRGHWGKDWVTRLFTRDRRYVERRVHEALEPVPNPGRLRGTLRHVPYRDLAHQLEKMQRYARWGAEDLYDRGARAGFLDLCGSPLSRFLRAYLAQGAILDGRFGLVTSVLGGYAAFLKYAHLWAMERRT